MTIRLPKYKIIKKKGKIFLHRLSLPTPKGSIKIHLILNDDLEYAHIHPWKFTSLLLVGAYKEEVNGKIVKHWPLSIVRNDLDRRHKVLLYRLFGIPIPCLTIGIYSKKLQRWCEHKQLCDGCKPHGQCLDKAYWINEENRKNRIEQ